MITRTHAPPVVRQCQLLELARSTADAQPRPVSASDLALMRRIDELHLACLFAGARMLGDLLPRAAHRIGRKRVRTMMARMGIEALYRKPTTSQRHPAHQVSPYLLCHLEITRSNQVWAADITYLPMTRGFVYLFAVLDWASRRVLAWRLSNTLTTDFCIEAVQISMDGTGCWRDNVFVERLWRSVKYEEVYLRAYDNISAARQGVGRYLTFYYQQRPHRALDGKTPDQVYCDNLTTRFTAA